MADNHETNISGEDPPPSTDMHSYNITGKTCDQVVDSLSAIVNNRKDYQEDAVFTIMITPISSNFKHPEAFQKEFKLTAKPTEDQPGNGIVAILQGGKFIGRPYDEAMVKDLEEIYNGDTSAFARHLKKLFQNNETIAKYPFVTSEVYMLLLFERARRTVVKDSDKSTLRKKRLDKLPIKEAIQDILTLFDNKKCEFCDVFLKEGKFHCFTGGDDKRETAVEELKKASSTDKESETESEINGSLHKQVQNLTLLK